MKIIKKGKNFEDFRNEVEKVKRFSCSRCECVFDAKREEYVIETQYNEVSYGCKCPNCCKMIYTR